MSNKKFYLQNPLQCLTKLQELVLQTSKLELADTISDRSQLYYKFS